jgi:hypothetical protein
MGKKMGEAEEGVGGENKEAGREKREEKEWEEKRKWLNKICGSWDEGEK